VKENTENTRLFQMIKTEDIPRNISVADDSDILFSIKDKDIDSLPKRKNVVISSVEDAVRIVRQIYQYREDYPLKYDEQYGNYILLREITAKICAPDSNISGHPDHFMEFITLLENGGDYDEAFKVCKSVMSRPEWLNCDWIAKMIGICIRGGKFDYVDEYLKKAETKFPRKEEWPDELFSIVIDWSILLITKFPTTINTEIELKKALCLAIKWRKIRPESELGYLKEAKIFVAVNKRNLAISRLKRYIFSHENLHCPECCEILLELMKNSTDYETKKRVAVKGLKCSGLLPESYDYFKEQFSAAEKSLKIVKYGIETEDAVEINSVKSKDKSEKNTIASPVCEINCVENT